MFFVSALPFVGCSATPQRANPEPTDRSWLAAHVQADPWLAAASPLNPQHLPSIATLVALPFLAEEDDRISRRLTRDRPVGGSSGSRHGDVVAAVLAGSPLVAAGAAAVFPPESDSALELVEVGVESVGWTVLATELLKPLVGRERPNNNSGRGGRANPSNRSFPSGHVASAMAGAVVSGRWLRAQSLWFVPAELALYGGVIYTAFTRVENDKHFPTDVAASIIIGGYLANTVWDAHYGRDGDGIFEIWKFVPAPTAAGDGILLMWCVNF
ncbi:MAG: phosphatase PAP2 family protein [Planctomycetota bacterium]